MADVRLRQVKKSFGKVDVIHGVDLDIESGEFAVFVGPSGCGKSTLLRLVAGLEEITSGSMSISDRDVTTADPSERGVAMVFQSYALYPHMTVKENMAFGLKMTGHPPEMIEERVAKAADILQLNALLDRKPKALSGGQRQRVAIGRSIVREPKVFLFDEPLSNLDAELRVQMRLEIAKLHADLGATMIYVTHDQVEAMTLADKIVVLRAGRVEQVGSPLHLYDDPDNSFVAGFIGSPKMNFLNGIVTKATGKNVTISFPDYQNATMTKALEGPLPAIDAAILVGIRPEHFDKNGDTKIEIMIDVIEHLGTTSFAYSNATAEEPLTIEIKEGRDIKPGAISKTGFNASSAYLFDPKTTLRLR